MPSICTRLFRVFAFNIRGNIDPFSASAGPGRLCRNGRIKCDCKRCVTGGAECNSVFDVDTDLRCASNSCADYWKLSRGKPGLESRFCGIVYHYCADLPGSCQIAARKQKSWSRLPFKTGAKPNWFSRNFKRARFTTYSFASAIASAGLFAYIAGSSFVFMELNGVCEQK